jgi:hypothetical protein
VRTLDQSHETKRRVERCSFVAIASAKMACAPIGAVATVLIQLQTGKARLRSVLSEPSFTGRGGGKDLLRCASASIARQRSVGQHYSHVRPHSSLGYLMPNQFLVQRQDQRPIRPRAGALRYMGPPRPGPLLNRDKCSQREKHLKLTVIRRI